MQQDKLMDRLQALYDGEGPFVSLYLNTHAGKEQGPGEVGLRWRALRSQAEAGIPEKALLLLDDLVDGSYQRGHGLIAITSGEEVVYSRSLERPIGDAIGSGALPSLLPLLEYRQDNPVYAVVVADRQSAHIHVVGGMRQETTVEVQGDHDELRKVNPGGWSQRRYQQRAEDSWEQNAADVAETLRKIVLAEHIELVVVMGDVRATSYLKEHAGPEVSGILQQLDTAPPTDDALDGVRDEIEAAVASLTAARVKTTLEKFLEERGQHDLCADGVDATFEALRMAQVGTLLLAPARIQGTAWFSRSDMTQGARTADPLKEIGLDDLEEGPLEDVLVRLALGTGADVRIVPEVSDDQGPSGGVGAILRYSTDQNS